MSFVSLRQPGISATILAIIPIIVLLSLSGCAVQDPRTWVKQTSAETGDTTVAEIQPPSDVPNEEPGTSHIGIAPPAGPPDSDGDGIADLHDHCRATPHGATVDEMGCPHDEDNDGVYDGIDRCPGTMAVVGVVVDSTGCPSDADGDGVPDHHDLCPDTPPGVSVTPRGCPADADSDGVPDYLDQCPDTPSGIDVTSTGCEPDGDGDGIPDPRDLCPHTPKGLKVDETGCLVMTQLHRRLILHVDYAPGTTDPDRLSLRVLDDLALRLAEDPGVVAIVEGFTDNIGLDSANLAVSQKRADKIAQYLTKKGVKADRIESHGRGESHFIADNATAAGRRKNRRIEISFR